MLLSYKYKLRPNQEQSIKLSKWLDLLRATYNWCLKDRIDGWYQQFLMGEYCDLQTQAIATPLTCAVVKGTQARESLERWKWSSPKRRRKR